MIEFIKEFAIGFCIVIPFIAFCMALASVHLFEIAVMIAAAIFGIWAVGRITSLIIKG